MIPYMLCHGRVYERLGRTGEFQTHELEVEHGFTRLCVYYMYDGFWDDPRWKFAPPQAVLAAGGFRVLAPPPASPPNIDLTRSRKAPPQKKPFPKKNERPKSNGIVVDVVSGRTEKGPPAGYVCKKCGVPGHFLKQCPQFEQRAPRAPKGPPDGYVCHKCGVSGHWIKDCPQAAVRSPAPAAPSLRRAKVSEESRRAASAWCSSLKKGHCRKLSSLMLFPPDELPSR